MAKGVVGHVLQNLGIVSVVDRHAAGKVVMKRILLDNRPRNICQVSQLYHGCHLLSKNGGPLDKGKHHA